VVDMLKAHVRNAPPDIAALKPELPAPLVEFIRGALMKKPGERLTDWTRIRELLTPRQRAPDLWSDARESVVHIRYLPGAAGRVDQALRTLVADLESTTGVRVAKAELTCPLPLPGPNRG
jgi:hypothetical protein